MATPGPTRLQRLDQINLAETIAALVEVLKSPQRCAGCLDVRSDIEAPQDPHCVGLEDNSRPQRPPGGATLDKLGRKAPLPQGDGGRQARDAAAYDKDVRCGRHVTP